MTRSLLVVIAFSFVSLADGQPSPSPSATPDDVAELLWLDHADVKADFHRVVEEQHDMRFLAIGSISRNIPTGLYDPDQLISKYGSRDLAVGCVVSGEEAIRLREKAKRYASEYNQMLVRYLVTQTMEIVVLDTSIKIESVELRSGLRHGKYHYISRAAAEKVLGHIADTYYPGRVVAYSWSKFGIHIQEGTRGAEAGKIFKFQVYLEDDYDARTEKQSGKFSGHVQVDGLDVGPTTTFEMIRDELKKKGYKITEQPELSSATRSGSWGQTQIFAPGSSGKIARIEVWCL